MPIPCPYGEDACGICYPAGSNECYGYMSGNQCICNDSAQDVCWVTEGTSANPYNFDQCGVCGGDGTSCIDDDGGYDFSGADFNQDGVVNILDVVLLINNVLGNTAEGNNLINQVKKLPQQSSTRAGTDRKLERRGRRRARVGPPRGKGRRKNYRKGGKVGGPPHMRKK